MDNIDTTNKDIKIKTEDDIVKGVDSWQHLISSEPPPSDHLEINENDEKDDDSSHVSLSTPATTVIHLSDVGIEMTNSS